MNYNTTLALIALPVSLFTLAARSASATEVRSLNSTPVIVADRYDFRLDRREEAQREAIQRDQLRREVLLRNEIRDRRDLRREERRVWISGHFEPGFLGIGRHWVEGHWETR